MAQEMSPSMYAAHVGIPVSTVEAWLHGAASVLIDNRDIRQINGRLTLIAVQAPNASGEGARPRFIPNPAYKYERKRKSVHEAGGTGSVQVIPVQGTGIPRMAQPSMAELRCEGTSTGEGTSSASTRPSESRIGTRRVPSMGFRNGWMKARAFATGIEFGS